MPSPQFALEHVARICRIITSPLPLPPSPPLTSPSQFALEHVARICRIITSPLPLHPSPPLTCLSQFALEHVARICRIITSPGGNALLVGLTRLAAFMGDFEVFQVSGSIDPGLSAGAWAVYMDPVILNTIGPSTPSYLP